jgi:hypothetical protein
MRQTVPICLQGRAARACAKKKAAGVKCLPRSRFLSAEPYAANFSSDRSPATR